MIRYLLKKYGNPTRWRHRWRYKKFVRLLEKATGSEIQANYQLQQCLQRAYRVWAEHPSSLRELEMRLTTRETPLSAEEHMAIVATLEHLKGASYYRDELHRARAICTQYQQQGEAFIRKQLRAAHIDPLCIATVMTELNPESLRQEAVSQDTVTREDTRP